MKTKQKNLKNRVSRKLTIIQEDKCKMFEIFEDRKKYRNMTIKIIHKYIGKMSL